MFISLGKSKNRFHHYNVRFFIVNKTLNKRSLGSLRYIIKCDNITT